MRLSSSTSTRRASSRGHRRTNRAMRKLAACWTSSRKPPGQEQVQRLEKSVKDLKPQLGRTEALAEDLKQQVELLRRDYKEIAWKACAKS